MSHVWFIEGRLDRMWTYDYLPRGDVSISSLVLKFLWMMKSFVAIFFAILLFLATMEADGKRMTLEKERDPSNHQLGRKADIGAKDDIDLTGEDGSDMELIASKNRLIDSRHHIYMNDTSPIPRKHP
ncbi:hypothetical protein Gohar_027254 [Gossypium harknessii]|uniref:Uncharacterized protein n=1 Tax=Gossypium harknessii TaxID=34285 RepID=A0A7J9HUU7_9ROSI|nr:hypothetical protein [Gossypium harknessii]